MKKYKPLKWPRFSPFLRWRDELPSHRINIYSSNLFATLGALLILGIMADSYPYWLQVIWVVFTALVFFLWVIVRLTGGSWHFIEAPNRNASNYIATIIAKKDLDEWTIQQEIFESRYWLKYFWRLTGFYWFYCSTARYDNHKWWMHSNGVKFIGAAVTLAEVECASRAHEILTKWKATMGDTEPRTVYAQRWFNEEIHDYATSIYRAPNYPFFEVLGWDKNRVKAEITKNLHAW